jgi:tetratricopeptide (TPR) repeat protein
MAKTSRSGEIMREANALVEEAYTADGEKREELYRKAAELMMKAAPLAPRESFGDENSETGIYHMAGGCFEKAGDFRKAADCYRLVAEKTDDVGDSHFFHDMASSMYQKSGDAEKAKDERRKAKAIEKGLKPR